MNCGRIVKMRINNAKAAQLRVWFEDKRRRRLVAPAAIVPPHEVLDPDKVNEMVRTLETGGELLPIYLRDNGKAVSGVHRLAACKRLGCPIAAIRVTERQFADACFATGQNEDQPEGLELWAIEDYLFLRAPKRRIA